MDHSEFLASATRLTESDYESDLRSSVSRAHYSAYHAAKELVEEFGVNLGRHSSHDKLHQFLGSGGHEIAKTVGAKLESLKNERKTADYNLASSKFQKKPNAILQVKAAQLICEQLEECKDEPTYSTIREKVRSIARINGCIVMGNA